MKNNGVARMGQGVHEQDGRALKDVSKPACAFTNEISIVVVLFFLCLAYMVVMLLDFFWVGVAGPLVWYKNDPEAEACRYLSVGSVHIHTYKRKNFELLFT